MKVSILNYGCVNEEAMYDSLMSKMKQYGIERTTKLEETDYLVIITCGGLGSTIQEIASRLIMLNSYTRQTNMKVIIVGCLVSRLKLEVSNLLKLFKDNPNMKIIDNIEWIVPAINYMCDMNMRNTSKEKLYNRTFYNDRDGIAIQFRLEWGCSNKCSFCKTNYMNTTPVSVPYEHALNYLKNMVKNGTKVISLGGTNLTLYGIDLYKRQRLHEFIHELSQVDGLERISLDELVAGNMYKELIDEIITNPKIDKTSFQLETASDRLLKLMNRSYSIDEYDYYVKKVIDSGKYVDTVLMSGFPTETESDMDYTIKYLKNRGIITQVISQYDDFKGLIPSSELEQLTEIEKRKHTRYLTDNTNIINFNIFAREMPKQTKLIYARSKDGTPYFNTAIPDVYTIPYGNRFNDLEPGTIIYESPKRLVKCNKITQGMTYKVG